MPVKKPMPVVGEATALCPLPYCSSIWAVPMTKLSKPLYVVILMKRSTDVALSACATHHWLLWKTTIGYDKMKPDKLAGKRASVVVLTSSLLVRLLKHWCS
jgi:hypothetical protein